MSFAISIARGCEALRPWLESLPARFDSEGRTIYHSRNHIKVMTAPDGTLLNVKQYHRPAGPNRLFYSWGLRAPKGRRAFHYAAVLTQKGILTPRPVGYIEERTASLLGLSYLVTEQCPYTHTLYELPNLDATAAQPLAVALARHTAMMHERGVLHRDYSPGNILWDAPTPDSYTFSVVDINRMHFGTVTPLAGCRNFCRLWSSKDLYRLMVRTYAECRQANADELEAEALSARTAFWKRYARRHEIPFRMEW